MPHLRSRKIVINLSDRVYIAHFRGISYTPASFKNDRGRPQETWLALLRGARKTQIIIPCERSIYKIIQLKVLQKCYWFQLINLKHFQAQSRCYKLLKTRKVSSWENRTIEKQKFLSGIAFNCTFTKRDPCKFHDTIYRTETGLNE